MRFRLAGPLCALLVSFPLAAGSPQGTPGAWYRYPLPGAEVKSLAADPALPGVFWAGTAQGGIYRSSDGGVSWTSPPAGAPFPGYAVTSLAVDPAHPGAVWAGLTGVVKGGLLAHSTDLGRSFEVVRRWEDRAGARVVAVMSRSGRKAVGVGGDWGLEISTDDGVTWRASAPPLDAGSGISFMAFDPVRPGVLYCGSFRHPFRSLDGGLTWARIANGMVEDTEVFGIEFAPDDPNDFWAATCGWVYRTTDGGAKWTRYREGSRTGARTSSAWTRETRIASSRARRAACSRAATGARASGASRRTSSSPRSSSIRAIRHVSSSAPKPRESSGPRTAA